MSVIFKFKNIIITMKDGEVKPISNARDTQEIPYEQGKIMIQMPYLWHLSQL